MPKSKKTAVVKSSGKKKASGAFEIKLTTGGEVYETKADSIAEAVLGFDIKSTNTETLISVTYKKNTVEKKFMRVKAMRFFRNSMAALVLENNFKLALNAK